MAAAPLYSPNAPIFSGEGVSGTTPLAPSPYPALGGGPALTGQRVNVIAPNGETVSIDLAELPTARDRGFQVESAEHAGIRKYVDENKGIGGAAKVALRGFVDEAVFGAADPLIDATRDPYELAKWRALKADHEVANIAGRVGGFGLSLLYGGELFGTASKAGGAAAKILGRGAAEAVEKAAGRAVAAELAYRAPTLAGGEALKVGGGVAGKILQSAADLGVQGAVLSSPKAMAQLIVGDPDRAAETWLWGAAGGAALGGLAGGIGGVAGRLMGRGVEPVAMETAAAGENLLGTGLADKAAAKLRKFGDEQAISALNMTQKYSGRLKRIKGGTEEAARIVREHDLAQFAGDAEAMAAKVQELRSGVGERIGAIYDAKGIEKVATLEELAAAAKKPIVDAAKTPGQVGASETVDSWISKELLGPFQPAKAAGAAIESKPGLTWREFVAERMGPYMKEMGSHGDAIKKIGAEWQVYKAGAGGAGEKVALAGEEAVSESAGLSLRELHDLRRAVDKATRWDATVSNEVNELRKDVRDALTGLIEQKLDAASKDLGRELLAELRPLNKQYGVLKTMADAAEHNVVRGMSNRRHSLTDYLGNQIGATIGGFVGGAPGSLVGGYVGGEANNVLRRWAPGYMSKGAHAAADMLQGRGLVQIEEAFAKHSEQLEHIPRALEAMSAGKVAERAPLKDTLGVNVLTRFLEAHDAKLDDQKGLMQFADRLASLASDPANMPKRIAEHLADIEQDAPEVAAVAAAKMAQAAAYLHDTAPKPPALKSPWEPALPWQPSAAQVKEYKTRVKTALDPYSAIDAMMDGSLTKAHVETLQVLAPKLYEEMVRRVMEFGASGKAKPMPYAQRLRLSMLTGAPLDRTLTQLAGYQQAFSSQHAQEQPRGGAGALKAPALATDVQRVSA